MALKQGYGFSRDDHRRVSRVVQQFEQSPFGSVQKGPTVSISDPIRDGVTTSTITARTGVSGVYTPGSGTAQFYDYDRGTNLLTLGPEITVFNRWTESVGANFDAVFNWRGGVWWVMGSACSGSA